MNYNFLIFVLMFIIIYLYHSRQRHSIQICKKMKISPTKFNPAIHHPAML